MTLSDLETRDARKIFFRRISVRTLVPFDTLYDQSWNGDTYGEGMIWNSGASAPKIWNRLHLRTDYQESNKILHGDQIV